MRIAILAAFALMFVGCQQQPPIVINNPPQYRDHYYRVPVQPPLIINGCNYHNHCGRYGCPVCRSNGWYRCSVHDHCGSCPACRSHGWLGVHIGGFGVGVGVRP